MRCSVSSNVLLPGTPGHDMQAQACRKIWPAVQPARPSAPHLPLPAADGHELHQHPAVLLALQKHRKSSMAG